MRPQEFAPNPVLLDYVYCFWQTERLFDQAHPTFTVYPDSFVELIFSLGVPCSVVDEQGERPLPAVYLVGLLNKPFTIRAAGSVRIVAARLYAWALPLLLSPPTASRNPVTSLADQFGYLLDPLLGSLNDSRPDRAMQILETCLLERLGQANRRQDIIWKRVRRQLDQNLTPSVYALADAVALSNRQVERLFKQSAGVSPKALLQRIRFEKARNQLWGNPRQSLTKLAYSLGFADQAHFSREFRRLARCSPRQFAQRMQAARHLMAQYNVAFMQVSAFT